MKYGLSTGTQRAPFRVIRFERSSFRQAPGSGSLPSIQPKQEHLQRLDIVTLFPAMFDGPMSESLLGRARQRGLFTLHVHNLRDWAKNDRHRTVDERPYG